MKKLLILALLPLAAVAADKPKPAPVEAAQPDVEKPRKPGFWERAWGSAKKTGEGVGHFVTKPFGGGKNDEKAKNWRGIAVSLNFEPAEVKLSSTKAVKVLFAAKNEGEHAVQLDFPTTQRIEVILKTQEGKLLAKWSEDQKVEPEQGFLVINPDERLEYSATISTRDMQAGQTYVVEAYFPSYPQLKSEKAISPAK